MNHGLDLASPCLYAVPFLLRLIIAYSIAFVCCLAKGKTEIEMKRNETQTQDLLLHHLIQWVKHTFFLMFNQSMSHRLSAYVFSSSFHLLFLFRFCYFNFHFSSLLKIDFVYFKVIIVNIIFVIVSAIFSDLIIIILQKKTNEKKNCFQSERNETTKYSHWKWVMISLFDNRYERENCIVKISIIYFAIKKAAIYTRESHTFACSRTSERKRSGNF